MEELGVLYKATDSFGKCYIGQHAGDGSDIGVTYFGSGTEIKAIIKERGKDFFTYWVFSKELTKSERNKGEIYYIKFFQARDYQNGYNKHTGGSGGDIYSDLSEEKKAEINKKHKDAWNNKSEEEKAEISKKHKDAWNNKSEEEKAEINKKNSDSNKITNRTPEARKRNSESQLIAQSRPERRKRNSESQLIAQNRPEVKQHKSDIQKIIQKEIQNRLEVIQKHKDAWNNKSEEEKAFISKKQSETHKIISSKPERRLQLISAGLYANHIRWDVNRGIINPNCKFCINHITPSSFENLKGFKQ